MAATSLREFVKENMPSPDKIRENGSSALLDIFTAAKNNYDALQLGQQISRQMAGMKNEAMPAASLSNLAVDKGSYLA